MKPHLSQFLIIALKYVRNPQGSKYVTEGLLKLLGMQERAIEYGKKMEHLKIVRPTEGTKNNSKKTIKKRTETNLCLK